MSIRVRARPDKGIRRVGVHHPAEPTVYPEGFFSDEEIEVLRNDADLVVELVEEDFLTPGEREQLARLERVGGTHASDVGHALASQPDGPLAERSAAGDDAESSLKKTAEEQELPEPPAVARLAEFLASIDSVVMIRALQARDDRATAQPVYDARLLELEDGN